MGWGGRMELDDRALPLTRGQLDIWLAQETGHSGTEWQLGLFVRIEGTVERDALEWAIRRVMREAEPVRAACFEVDGQVFQRAIDYPDVELDFYDLSGSRPSRAGSPGIASSIQRTPMPFTGPLFKFALFRTRLDEFYLVHVRPPHSHRRIRHWAGWPSDCICLLCNCFWRTHSSVPSSARCRTWLTASWNTKRPPIIWKIRPIGARNLPAESGPHYRLPQAAGERDPYWPSAPVRLDPAVLRRVDELSRVWNVPRSSVITAACALLVRGWCAEGSEVVLDFPVSRRVRPESKTLPGMVAGVVPLVLRVSPGSTVAGFCEHVDTRIREAVQHQRFPVHALERKAHPRGPGQPADRVSVNFIPSIFTLDFGGVAASASYTNSGLVGGFGLIFSGVGDQLFLSTAGAGGPFSNFDVSDLAGRLERVLVAMTADPTRRLSSMDVLDAGEHARLDGWGNRAVLTQPATAGVDSGVVRCAGGAHAGGGGADLRGPVDDLPRAGGGG